MRKVLLPLAAALALAAAGYVLYRVLAQYSLEDIGQALASLSWPHLGLAVLFAAGSYLVLTGFDYFGTRYTRRPLPYRKVALASFISLSIGQNIGFAGLSSGAIRYRFYSQWGLGAGDVARIVLFSGVTVALGLATLGGIAFLAWPSRAADLTGLSRGTLLGLGALCILFSAGYLGLAASARRSLKLWRWRVFAPPADIALMQIVLGTLDYVLVAACLHQTLSGAMEVSYAAVAAVYVIANVLAILSHVPGGLGVLEAVVLIFVPQVDAVAALAAFRTIYYFVPLAIGSVLFAASEFARRRRPTHKAV